MRQSKKRSHIPKHHSEVAWNRKRTPTTADKRPRFKNTASTESKRGRTLKKATVPETEIHETASERAPKLRKDGSEVNLWLKERLNENDLVLLQQNLAEFTKDNSSPIGSVQGLLQEADFISSSVKPIEKPSRVEPQAAFVGVSAPSLSYSLGLGLEELSPITEPTTNLLGGGASTPTSSVISNIAAATVATKRTALNMTTNSPAKSTTSGALKSDVQEGTTPSASAASSSKKRSEDLSSDNEQQKQKTKKLNKIKDSQKIKVYGGTSRLSSGGYCVFPFTYDGEVRHSCLPSRRGGGSNDIKRTWCALSSNYDRDTLWAYCDENHDKVDDGVADEANKKKSDSDEDAGVGKTMTSPTIATVAKGDLE